MHEELAKRIDDQYSRNQSRWGKQPVGTLLLEMEDQLGKLRDAFLHRTVDQVERRLVNIGSLVCAASDALEDARRILPRTTE